MAQVEDLGRAECHDTPASGTSANSVLPDPADIHSATFCIVYYFPPTRRLRLMFLFTKYGIKVKRPLCLVVGDAVHILVTDTIRPCIPCPMLRRNRTQ